MCNLEAMEPLKEMFNANYYRKLAKAIKRIESRFSEEAFLKAVLAGIDNRSLNERMRHTSVVLQRHLPDDFTVAVKILYKVIPQMSGGYTNLVFPDFVSQFGLQHFKVSMEALEYFTAYGSSEFAIRVFLKHDFHKTLTVMKSWAKSSNHHVRRLASEGSRPRLPWSFKLDAVIADPSLTSPILEMLKEDPELYVRKSVANHLNDISKEHPDYMLTLISGWNHSNPHTAWIIKHASRTLIKKGHAGSLAVFKFEKNPRVKISALRISKPVINLGEALQFEFSLVSEKQKPQKLVIDYVIHYVKKSGELSPKVFKLKELVLASGEEVLFHKKQIIKDFTTRKHEAGKHLLEIQINGIKMGSRPFELLLNSKNRVDKKQSRP
jgi:3-methyladenine DNA glycosylase AlkC